MGLFRRKTTVTKSAGNTHVEDIKRKGTMIHAVVTDVIVKRNGYIVMAVYEDRWLGTQTPYTSELLTQKPVVHIGGEVIVYVDDVGAKGDYYVDC